MVVESDLLKAVGGRYELSGPLPALAIPSTLQDSLTARLDRLSAARESLQLAAVLGRDFSYELIQSASPLDDVVLSQQLGQLVTSEFLYQRGVQTDTHYTFKHSLIQDAAYNSLLITRRQQYHKQVAQVLEERFADTVENQPELVAHHYTEAGFNQQAVACLQQAGQIAMRRSANVEALNHINKGLELLDTLPDTPGRAPQEVALLTLLGQAWMQIKSFSAPEIHQAFSRAKELIDQGEETSHYFQVMFGLFTYYFVGAEYELAREVAEQNLEAAQRSQDPFTLPMAHRFVGTVLLRGGEPALAQEHFLQAAPRYDLQQHRSLALTYGNEPTSTALAYSARSLWVLGYPDQASILRQESIALAHDVSHPFTLAFVESAVATYYFESRAIQSALDHAETLIELAEEQGFAFWLEFATRLQAACLVQLGRTQGDIESLTQRLTTSASLLAEAHLYNDNAEDGLKAVAEAIDHVNETGDRFWEAELYRIKGELLMLLGGSESEAEGSFNQALEVAIRQSAKSLELRSVMSLARLWQMQGKPTEARELLAAIYGWFTEGFDTPDLIEAKTLHQELS